MELLHLRVVSGADKVSVQAENCSYLLEKFFFFFFKSLAECYLLKILCISCSSGYKISYCRRYCFGVVAAFFKHFGP